MINNVALTGRLAKDIEVAYSQSGTAIGKFTLGVRRNRASANGEYETDWIRCLVFGKSAETMANYLSKGSLIGVTGRIQTGIYDNKQGQKVYTTDIVVDNFAFLESKKTADNGFQQNGHTNTSNYHQNQNTTSEFPSSNMLGDTVEINDDDLPF